MVWEKDCFLMKRGEVAETLWLSVEVPLRHNSQLVPVIGACVRLAGDALTTEA